MAFIKQEVFCIESHADFKTENGDFCLMDSIENGKIVLAENRPEAAAKTVYYDNGITKHYIKRSVRKEFFSPRDRNHITEHETLDRGIKKWDFYEVPEAAIQLYKADLTGRSTLAISKLRQVLANNQF